MTGASLDLEPRPEDPDRDQVLLDRVRAGDGAAFGELYDEHAGAARRLAVFLAGPDAADDLVSESFARILDLLGTGGGPTSNFRAYLYAAIRNRYRDNLRTSHESPSSDAPWLLDADAPAAEDLVPVVQANGAVAALTSLPNAWQQVLWYLEVEGRKPAEVADLLAMTPVAVSSLAYRAREGLRRAYLDQHLVPGAVPEQCRWTRDRLSQYVRGDLSGRARAKLAGHLETCAGCTQAYGELDRLNAKLAALLFPVVLVGAMKAVELAGGAAPAGSLAASLNARASNGSGAGASAAAAGGGLASGFALADLSARALTVIALVAAGTVAAAATAWAVIATDDHPHPRRPAAASTQPTASPTPTPTAPLPSTPVPTPTPTPTVAPPTAEVLPVVLPAAPDPTAGPTSEPAAGPTPALVAVRPQRPLAVPISGCGSYGSLTLPSTTGVRYLLAAGDGRQGAWEVTARARRGYRIADGAATTFTGNLGTYAACPVPPSIGSVSKVAQGDPVVDPWDVTVTPVVPVTTAHGTVEVDYVFSTGVFIKSRSGAGWTCREPGGVEVGAGTEYYFPDPGTVFTCSFDYTGTAPPPVTMTVQATDAAMQVVDPAGQVTLRSAGTQVDQRSF